MDASYIKQSVTMRDALARYGQIDTGREQGRIPCPLHNGHDKNFAYKARSFKCFVCGESGSVIDFTMKLLGLSFSDACKRLNADFGLGLDDEPPSKESRAEALKMREARRAAEERERRRFIEETRREMEAIEAARREKERMEPFILAGEIFWPPGYGEASRKLDYLEYLRDEKVAAQYYAACEADWERKEAERNWREKSDLSRADSA